MSLGNSGGVPIEGGNVPVAIQDQHTPAFVAAFCRVIDTFELGAPVTPSTVETLSYTFTAEAGHGLSGGETIRLRDAAHNRMLYAAVTNVATNTITLDRPLDYAFAVAGTACEVVSCALNVDGSSTPAVFSVIGGADPVDITAYSIYMAHSAEADDSKFGGIAALANGVVHRIVDGYQKTVGVFRSNGDFRALSDNLEYSNKAGGGAYGTSIGIDMRRFGVVHRISSEGALQLIVRDNLSSLTSLRCVAIGHQTTGEGEL